MLKKFANLCGEANIIQINTNECKLLLFIVKQEILWCLASILKYMWVTSHEA